MNVVTGYTLVATIITTTIVLASTGCENKEPPKPYKPYPSNWERIEVDGLECLWFNDKRGYASAGGITCNWEKYNRGKL